jgi:pantetheine-phosphate adenylyltransferase
MVRALFPGSFDPVTLGHLDLVHRGLDMFESLTLGVARNISKQAIFSLEERVEMLEECLPDSPTLSVITFSGLMVDFCREQGYGVIVRGLRSSSDFEYEFQMAQTNRQLDKSVETVLMMTSPNCSFISSSLIKDIARNNGDVSSFVPESVARRLKQRLSP